ncbi:MAG TPA: beta-galactosidase GalB [Bacteroidota bacterium]|nr:beta-galactosidase GalB [Bacteroidota bacterium]
MPDGTSIPEPPHMEATGVDEGGWQNVDLPHDWAIGEGFRKNLPSNTGKLPWQGIGWYRKHFRVPQEDKGRVFFVDFDGAMSHAKVWLNGRYVGEWPYGYASFRLELTSFLRFGEDNVIAVRLENPEGFSRWYPGGGIYRNVWLVKTEPVHLAHWGTFVSTPQVDPTNALVRVQTEIQNQGESPANVELEQSIVLPRGDHGDSLVTKFSDKSIEITPGKSLKIQQETSIASPHLWSIASPQCYLLRTMLKQAGKLIEQSTVRFGIRTAVFDAVHGFLLNGQRVRINGVCDHHDLGPLGAAVTVKGLERQIRILKEMGCNAIRTSHNPPAPELLDVCDKMGMLVLDEAFDCWIEGKVPNDYSSLFPAWHEKDIRALVRRDRNHPSVIMWSCGNEVREQENGIIAGELRRIFLSEDPTRPVTAACDNPRAGFNGFQDSVDVFGYNYKPNLYGRFRQANPEKPLFGSETASCISSNGEYFFPVSDDKLKGAQDGQVSSYDLCAPPWATIPDVEFAGEDKNPSVAGEFVWTGFDYLGEPTPYSEDTSSSRSSYFGILDLCGFRKDRFYLYQSRWKPDLPMAHILPHWNWPGREGKITPVHVYTSGDEAELFLNGKSLGRQKKGPFEYRLRWDSVTYEPGKLMVIAYRNGREWARDERKTTGPVSAILILPEDTVIHSDGNDLSYCRIVGMDKDGTQVPTAENLIRFHVDGPATIAAVANGDATCMDSFRSDRYPLFNGQCLVILRSEAGKPGNIRLTAESGGLSSGSANLQSR